MRELRWKFDGGRAQLPALQDFECLAHLVLPASYKNLMCEHNGGEPQESAFEFFDKLQKRKNVSGITFFSCGDPDAPLLLEGEYSSPPPHLPKGLIAFGEVGNGDLVCFDYRSKAAGEEPSIIYWHHAAPESDLVSPLADSFDAFLDLLFELSD